MSTEALKQKLQNALQQTFNFPNFRPGQEEAIVTLLTNNKLLCIQPTGHGKSLLYQLPATLLSGITLVVSPLLALVRDQVFQLRTRFNIPAAAINSDQNDEENYQVEQQARNQQIKILFIAPEQIDRLQRMEFLLSLPIELVVVDEAHCISTWGHDFRPSYRQIINLVKSLHENNPKLKVLGLTATANQRTQEDIVEQLSFNDQAIEVHRESMDRPNIALTVLAAENAEQKLATMTTLLNTELEGCGLIYCSTRDNTLLVAEYLQSHHINAVAYHAGMHPDAKRQLQRDFIDNKYKVIAATNALGMGIDKSDLRFIIHFDIPGSITAYYQEVGRCGRDGLPARGILLYNSSDLRVQHYFINSSQPTLDDFDKTLKVIQDTPDGPRLLDIKSKTGLHPTLVNVIIAELCEQGLVEKKLNGRNQVYLRTAKRQAVILDRYDAQLEVKKAELSSMTRFATQKNQCLMFRLRRTLGDKEPTNCGHCSICKPSSFKVVDSVANTSEISGWLNTRTCTITATRTNAIAEGVALLDSQLRSTMFVDFMRQRAQSNPGNIGMTDLLMQKLLSEVKRLHKKYKFSAIVPVPSRTWGARDTITRLIAKTLRIDMLGGHLQWNVEPENRQGELLNNDQRRFNVTKKMGLRANTPLVQGPVLLFDDYIGSGHTIKEAARCLRQQLNKNFEIVPLTIVQVKWRLGKSGMV